MKPVQLTTFAQDYVPSYMQSWNLTTERQLGPDVVVRAAYVGSKGTHLRAEIEQNAAIFGPGATIANTQARRINPDFSTVIETFASNTEQGSANVPDPWNLRSNRGLSDFDVPNRLVFSSVYSLSSLSSAKAPLRAIFGGRQTSGIWTWQNAFPFSISSGADNSRTGINQDRADYTAAASPNLSGDRSLQEKLDRYFNTSVFTTNALGTFGNTGRNIMRGMSSFNIDFATMKYFQLHERVRLQFRGEFFNATNTPFFGNPGATVGNPAFGKINSAGSPRILQFAIKLLFRSGSRAAPHAERGGLGHSLPGAKGM